MQSRIERAETLATGAVVTCAILAALSSWVFALWYVPSMNEAHASLVYAETANVGLAHLRALKWWAESGLVASLVVVLAIMVWRRSFADRGRGRYLTLLGLLGATLLWSFAGQLLPMDQYAWHGTVVRKGIVESVPVVGTTLRDVLFGSSGIGTTTLTRFHVLHIALLPPLLLLGAWLVFRSRARTVQPVFAIGALIAAAILLVGSHTFVPSLDIAARPHKPLADVRPEWFFVPLSMVLRLWSWAALAAHLALGAMTAALLVWPWVSKYIPKIFDRAALCLVLCGAFGLLAWGVGQDYAENAGSFARPDLEKVMGEMGEMNEKLGFSDEAPDLSRAALAVADMLILIEQTRSLAGHEDVKDADKWRKWCDELRSQTLEIWRDPFAWEKNGLREKMRGMCDDCHALQEEDEDVRPLSPSARAKAVPLSERSYRGLEATQDLPQDIDSLMKRMRAAYHAMNSGGETSAQAVLDLEALTKTLGPFFDSEGLVDIGERAVWDATIRDILLAIERIRAARDETAYFKELRGIYDACGSCHGEFGVLEEDVKLGLPRK